MLGNQARRTIAEGETNKESIRCVTYSDVTDLYFFEAQSLAIRLFPYISDSQSQCTNKYVSFGVILYNIP